MPFRIAIKIEGYVNAVSDLKFAYFQLPEYVFESSRYTNESPQVTWFSSSSMGDPLVSLSINLGFGNSMISE